MSRGLKNNNPGNIRNSAMKHHGEISTDAAFKQLKNMVYGYRAMFMLLYTYQKRHRLNTLREMIARYAPPVENHTDKYVETVSAWAGVNPDSNITAICREVMVPVVAAMSRVENGVQAVAADVNAGWELFIKEVR